MMGDENQMREFLGPNAVERALSHAIETCWMMLPADRKNMQSLRQEMERIFQRAMNNLGEDATAFGIPPGDEGS